MLPRQVRSHARNVRTGTAAYAVAAIVTPGSDIAGQDGALGTGIDDEAKRPLFIDHDLDGQPTGAVFVSRETIGPSHPFGLKNKIPLLSNIAMSNLAHGAAI